MSWSQMEDEAFDLEAGYSLDRPEERPPEVNQAEDNNKAQENSNSDVGQASRPLNRNFELERIDKLLAQNKSKQTFKITIVQQPAVNIKNHKNIIVALSLLGSPAISFNPLDYIVLSTNLIKVDTDEEVDELTGQTAIIIHGNNESMPLDLTIDSTTLRGEHRLTFNLYRIIIIGDTNVKLLCGTLHSKPFQVDTSRAKLQPSTYASKGNFSSTPKQVLQKLVSLHQILAPLKDNSIDELKRKKTHAHLWYGGLIWPRIGDSEQHYVELFMNTRHSFDLAEDIICSLPPLLEPKTVTLDSLLNDRHSFECQIYSPRVTGAELINAFRDKTTQKYWSRTHNVLIGREGINSIASIRGVAKSASTSNFKLRSLEERRELDQTQIKYKAETRINESHPQSKHLFKEFVVPDLIPARVLSREQEGSTKLENQYSCRGIKLITVTPIYITAMHFITQENQYFGIHKNRFCFYDFGLHEFIGTINRDRYMEAAERVVPHLEKLAPWLFDEQDAPRREDPVVMLTKPQDFNVAFVLLTYLYPTFSGDLKEEFDECLRSTHPNKTNVIRFVERNKDQLFSGIADPRYYHKVSSLILDATIVDSQNRLILSQIESSLAVRFLQLGSQKFFVADEYIFRESFVATLSQDVFKLLPNKKAQVKFNYGIFRQRKTKNDKKVAVGNKRGYNTDVVGVYEEYYVKQTEKSFSTKLECLRKMDQVIDADLRYSRFPGLILYMVSHALSMLQQRCFGRRIQSYQVHFEVPSRKKSYNRSSSRSSSRSSFSHGISASMQNNKYSQVHDSSHAESPKRLAPTNTQSVVHDTAGEERANRFDRPLQSEQNSNRNSPVQSRSNSLVITDITYVDNQPESQVLTSNTLNKVALDQKRKREESSEECKEESAKKRKIESASNGSSTQATQEQTIVTREGFEPKGDLFELLKYWK